MSRVGYGIYLEGYSSIALNKFQLRLPRGGMHWHPIKQKDKEERVRGSVHDERGKNIVLPSTDEQSRNAADASKVTFSSDLVIIVTVSHS